MSLKTLKNQIPRHRVRDLLSKGIALGSILAIKAMNLKSKCKLLLMQFFTSRGTGF